MIYMGGSCPLWLRLGKTRVSRGIVGKAWNPFKGIAFFLPFVTNYPSWVQVGSRTWGGGADEKASAVGAWWGFSPQTPSDRRSVWRADSSSHQNLWSRKFWFWDLCTWKTHGWNGWFWSTLENPTLTFTSSQQQWTAMDAVHVTLMQNYEPSYSIEILGEWVGWGEKGRSITQ